MALWICATCVNHHEGEQPPASCKICADERQWVPITGQRWTTLEELARDGHTVEFREQEPNLVGLGVKPGLGINQRGLLVRTSGGNLLWDPPGFLDDDAVRTVRELGGLAAVSSSHPHMYGAAVEWSRAFDAPILLPEADQEWMTRTDPAVRTWSGSLSPLPGVTLVQCGGHFPGSSVLHWADGADGAGVLLTGDTIYVTPGRDRVTFLWSAPNMLPLPERLVRQVVAAVRPYEFGRIYGGWWTSVLDGDAKQVVERCAERYVQFLRGDAPEA
ncbi:Metallo-beta-lactamase superfamily protein [Streptoalloteichus tenebrarius]|uniref:Metallo-beta-lactamase superfamily protein n=1 Tax=Streptoalloteichus tenebrarius (strain ATCC 17920 / DSM 40477 / JCM 4838 / CBS 697.72 / NBRC 16177 / NCIMB 11028 / NRRL B-12390 / A12253. 1 / ISP 5477) TaxID=1933 RepID=A0ABT1HLK9_STRSD|nr:MBL fold metallo-hydrolase [Streptoalloteichus tenebrarius]MCP2256397.1 Metallo-beta-lactamase superfamily protein [Streptoalloteichus tenebrarius]BFF04745.1 MBL fold metallo-hydrolase [Streptoalloteichus tenebrarius]